MGIERKSEVWGAIECPSHSGRLSAFRMVRVSAFLPNGSCDGVPSRWSARFGVEYTSPRTAAYPEVSENSVAPPPHSDWSHLEPTKVNMPLLMAAPQVLSKNQT